MDEIAKEIKQMKKEIKHITDTQKAAMEKLQEENEKLIKKLIEEDRSK